jgi:hypothetical protein
MITTEKIVNGIPVVEVTLEESDYAPKAMQELRLNTCNGCEFQIPKGSCSKCSCLLENRVKYIDMFCPEGKW